MKNRIGSVLRGLRAYVPAAFLLSAGIAFACTTTSTIPGGTIGGQPNCTEIYDDHDNLIDCGGASTETQYPSHDECTSSSLTGSTACTPPKDTQFTATITPYSCDPGVTRCHILTGSPFQIQVTLPTSSATGDPCPTPTPTPQPPE